MNFDAFSGKAPRSVYARFFGAPIHFAQAHASAAPRSRCTCKSLRQIAVDYLSRVKAPGQSLTSRVRQALRHTLDGTGGKKTDIADLLGIHPRTLQRQSRRHHRLEAASVVVGRAIGDYAFWRYLSVAGVVAIFFGASLIIVTTLPPRKLFPNHCQALI